MSVQYSTATPQNTVLGERESGLAERSTEPCNKPVSGPERPGIHTSEPQNPVQSDINSSAKPSETQIADSSKNEAHKKDQAVQGPVLPIQSEHNGNTPQNNQLAAPPQSNGSASPSSSQENPGPKGLDINGTATSEQKNESSNVPAESAKDSPSSPQKNSPVIKEAVSPVDTATSNEFKAQSKHSNTSSIDMNEEAANGALGDNSGSAASERRRWGSTINGDNHTCGNCGTTETPLWRRGPNDQVLCNACGLYIKARNIHRPVTLKRSPTTKIVNAKERVGSCPGDGRCNGTGGSQSCSKCPSFINNSRRNGSQMKHEDNQSGVNMVSCQNCGTVNTPLWRRDVQGHIICNACGLYNRMHKDARPADLQTAIVRRRKRIRPNSHDSQSFDEQASSGKSSPSGQMSPQNAQSSPAHSPPMHANASRMNSQSPLPPASVVSLPPRNTTAPPSAAPPTVHFGNHELCCQHQNPTIENTNALPPPGYPQGTPNLTHQQPVQGYQQQYYPQHSQPHQMTPYGFMPMHVQHQMPQSQQYVNQYNQSHLPVPVPQPPNQVPHHGVAPLPLPQPHMQPPAPVAHQQPQLGQQPQNPQQPQQPSVQQNKESNTKQGFAKDSEFSPLSVLQYLTNASSDTKKEYLLAAQRQLHDKMEDLRNKMRATESQLGDCEKALQEFNQ